MEEVDKGCPMIRRMGVSGLVFLLVLAYPDDPRPKAVKWLCVCVLPLNPQSLYHRFCLLSSLVSVLLPVVVVVCVTQENTLLFSHKPI